MARVLEAGLATLKDLKESLTYEEFMQLDEILEVKYINEIKVANYRKEQAERASLRGKSRR